MSVKAVLIKGCLLAALTLGAGFCQLTFAQTILSVATTDQSEARSFDGLSVQEIDAALATLTDTEARRFLALELHRKAQHESKTGMSTDGGFAVALFRFRTRLVNFISSLGEYARTLQTGANLLSTALPEALAKVAEPYTLSWALMRLAGLLVAGAITLLGTRLFLRSFRLHVEQETDPGFFSRLSASLLRLMFELVPVIVFAVVTLSLASLLIRPGNARTMIITYLTGALLVLISYIASRFVLAPYARRLRLVPLDDQSAIFLHRWLVGLVSLGTVAWLSSGLVILTGVPLPVHLTMVVLTGAVIVVPVFVMFWLCREKVATLMAGEDPESLRAQVAGIWHYIGVAYVGLVYLLWTLNMLARSPTAVWAAIGSLALVVTIPMVDAGVSRLLGRLLQSTRAFDELTHDTDAQDESSLSEAEQALTQASERRARYRQIAQNSSRLVVATLAVIMLLELWGFSLLSLAEPGAKEAFWSGLLDVTITIVISAICWQLVKALIDPHIPDVKATIGDEAESTPLTRAETLLPLLRMCLLVIIILVTVMLSLSSIGVDIGPLLAGAGVVGIAIGFGAQTLVRDIVSGIFFLIDDAFRIGEYIEFGDLRGEVEAITLRSLKLRHHRGAVHTVPFGELRSVTNYHRDWVIYKMEFRLPADTDVERVRKLIKKLGQRLLDDPDHGPNFLQPVKSQGISRVDETALILRVKFMCKPGQQFVLRRVVFQGIKDLFADNGIELAPRTVRVTTSSSEPANTGAATVLRDEAAAADHR